MVIAVKEYATEKNRNCKTIYMNLHWNGQSLLVEAVDVA